MNKSILETTIEDMNVSVRLRNCLAAADCHTVNDIVKRNKLDFLRLRNFGKRSLGELEDFLNDNGLSFGMKL